MLSVNYLFESSEEILPMKIGVVGYSAKKFDNRLAEKLIIEGLDKFKAKEGDELVSGLTDLGIPGLAYRIGKERKMKLIGIACERAHDEDSVVYPVDKEIIIGKNWGDESETFLKYIDVLIKVGGGKQSIEEFKSFKGPKIEFELKAED